METLCGERLINMTPDLVLVEDEGVERLISSFVALLQSNLYQQARTKRKPVSRLISL